MPVSRSRNILLAAVPVSVPAVCVNLPGAHAGTSDLRGADAVLQESAPLEAAPTPGPPSYHPNVDLNPEAEKLVEDIAAFTSAQPAGAAEAADAWLHLFARWRALASDRSSRMIRVPLSFGLLLRSLPPPEAWKIIVEQLREQYIYLPERTQSLLDLFRAFLLNDDRQLAAGLETAAARFEGKPFYLSTFHDFRAGLLADTSDAEVAVDTFQHLIPYRVDFKDEIPDLVGLVGEEKAASLLREVLTQTNVLALTNAGERTAALTRRLAAEMIDELGTPQWSLAESTEAGPLFKALLHRFGKGDDSSLRNDARARAYYLAGLIKADRIDDALAFVESDQKRGDSVSGMPDDAVNTLRTADKAKEVCTFFDRLLAKDPSIPNWETFINLISNVGDLTEALTRIEKVARNQKTPEDVRESVVRYPWKLYTNVDQVEKGIHALRNTRADEVPSEPLADDEFLGIPKFFEHGLKLTNLGRVLHRDDLIDEGLHASRFFFVQPTPNEPPDAHRPAVASPRQPNCARLTAYTAEKAGRPAVAEDILRAQWAADRRFELAQTRPFSNQPHVSRMRSREWFAQLSLPEVAGISEPRNDLVALAEFYGRQGRAADVMALLDHAPGWKAEDLGEIVTLGDWSKTPLGYTAARALDSLGRKEEALHVLDTLLETGCGYDPAYELFLQLTPPAEAIARLEHFFALDPLESRPLIWKAEALKRLGRLDEAETIARAAIAMDPSDGQAGCGLRMQACTTLGAVLAAAGKDPEPYRSAVSAIRLAEEGDDLSETHLLTRAVAAFRKAADLFPEAYCVQARLAMGLAKLGRAKEAAPHFRRAFELMPASLGQIGTPCSACGGVFGTHQAQEIAEEVFQRLGGEAPTRPRLGYLTGTLRQAEGRYTEALEAFHRATDLDPDDLNSWQQIEALGSYTHVSRAERDKALLNVLRLDPNRHHCEYTLDKIRDLTGLSNMVAAVEPRLRPVRPLCYPLAASAVFETERRKKILPTAATPAEEAADRFIYGEWREQLDPSQPLPRAAELIAKQESLRQLVWMVDGALREH